MLLTRRELLRSASATAFVVGFGHPPWAYTTNQAAEESTQAVKAKALKRILDDAALAMLKESPETATSLGVTEQQAGGPYMDRLSDLSPAGLDRQVAQIKATLVALDNLGRPSLVGQDLISYDVVYEAFANFERGSRFGFGNYGFSEPTPYVVDQLNGSYLSVPSFLDAQHPIRTVADVDAYLARLSAFAVALDQETERVKGDAARGIVPPDFAVRGALTQLQGLAAKPPERSDLVTSLRRRIGQAKDLDSASAQKALAQAQALMKDKVHPAFKRQMTALNANLKTAKPDAGLWHLKGGEAYYTAALQAWTTTRLSPDEIHQTGQELVKELKAEMDTILKSQGMTSGSVAQRIQSLSRDPQQLYPNTEQGRANLIADLNKQIADLQPLLKQNFGTLAKTKLEIRRVPPFKEVGSPGGYYESGSLDGSRPGYYYINLRDTAEWPKFTLPTLTYHEGEPGHHWQVSIAQANTKLPLIRSALLSLAGYEEGWALYSERLADEIGVYRDNPLGRLGYLKDAALRAGRLVVDTGMHAKHWSREQAIQFMMEAIGDSKSVVTTEIERYAVWPGQACAYMVGRQTIAGLRDEAQHALGSKFDVKAFHDVILTNGAMPLDVMQSTVRGWIKGVQAASIHN